MPTRFRACKSLIGQFRSKSVTRERIINAFESFARKYLKEQVLIPSLEAFRPCINCRKYHLISQFTYTAKIQKKALSKIVQMAAEVKVTEHQSRVYALLKQIPEGRVSTYAMLANALGSSPRAVGGALRVNPVR